MAILKPFFKGWDRAQHSSGEENKVACVSGKIHIQVSFPHGGEMERRFMLCHRTRSSLHKTQDSLRKCLETSLSEFPQTAKCRHFLKFNSLEGKKKKKSAEARFQQMLAVLEWSGGCRSPKKGEIRKGKETSRFGRRKPQQGGIFRIILITK